MVKERVRGKILPTCSQDIKIYETMAEAVKSRAEGINMEKGNVHHGHSKHLLLSALVDLKVYWVWGR